MTRTHSQKGRARERAMHAISSLSTFRYTKYTSIQAHNSGILRTLFCSIHSDRLIYTAIDNDDGDICIHVLMKSTEVSTIWYWLRFGTASDSFFRAICFSRFNFHSHSFSLSDFSFVLSPFLLISIICLLMQVYYCRPFICYQEYVWTALTMAYGLNLTEPNRSEPNYTTVIITTTHLTR